MHHLTKKEIGEKNDELFGCRNKKCNFAVVRWGKGHRLIKERGRKTRSEQVDSVWRGGSSLGRGGKELSGLWEG